jgi:hypothetical protein
MLTGELPLGKFAPPSKKVQIDVRLDEVVLHTLEKEPDRRYQHANQLKTDVETISGTVPPAAGFGAKGGPVPLLATPSGKATSDKIILPAFLLAFFFGIFGAHRFYVGKIWTAFLQLAALGGCILLIIACATLGMHVQPVAGISLSVLVCGCAIWATIDWILILCKAFTDGQGRRITNWLHSQTGEMKTGSSPLTGPPSPPPPGGTAPPAAAPPPAPMAQEKTPANGAGKIVAPAVGLMVAGMLKLFSALTALFVLTSPGASWLGKLLDDVGAGSLSHWGVLAGFSILLLKVVPAGLIFFGGLQMVQLRSYAWAVAASILAIVCCSLVGFPVSIWALIILARQDVRETFAQAAVSPSPKTGKKWPWILGTVAVAGVIVIGLIIAVVLALRPADENPNVNVRGTVNDAVTGKPIAGARVDDNRYGADTDKAPQQAWTDKSGHYKLKTWYEEHTIAASAPGYEPGLNTLFTKSFGSERELRMDFKLQPAQANAPATNGSSGMALNISSQDGQVVIETTNGRLSADKVQLQTDSNGSLSLTARKMDYVVTPTPPVPPVPPAPPVTASAEMSSQPITTRTLSEPNVHRTKIIGNLVTTDEFHQDFSQTLPLTANGRLSLGNVNGRIEIAGWDRNEVVIKALKHGKTRESVEAAKIIVNSSPDEIVIHTEQPSSVTGFPWSWLWFKNSKRNDAVVDYAIQVPQSARLKNISSVNGRIVIEDVSGDIEASTVNGQMQVQGAGGNLKLSTVNGRIEAEMASLGRGQSVSLDAVNGQLEAILPSNADAEVSASTLNGGISSEFASLVVKKEFPVGSNLKGKLGNGGAHVKASTVNGGIRFRRGKDVQ